MVKIAGDLGFLAATLGILIFAVAYLVSVRWWTDILGRAIGSVLSVVALIVVLSSVRVMGWPLPGLMWWRAILFPLLAGTVWVSLLAFFWYTYIAPKVKRGKRRRRQVDSGQPSNSGKDSHEDLR